MFYRVIWPVFGLKKDDIVISFGQPFGEYTHLYCMDKTGRYHALYSDEIEPI